MKRTSLVWITCLSLALAQLCFSQSTSPEITFLLNSGRPNHSALLTDAQVSAVAAMLQNLQSTSDPQWSNLGWRGFQIDNPSGVGSLPLEVVVFNCVIEITTFDGVRSYYQDTDGNLFAYLVRSVYIGGGVPLPTDTYIPSCTSDRIDFAQSGDDTFAPAASPWPTNGSEPAYNPAFWNAAAVRPDNNCYNYATNIRTDTFAQPGLDKGKKYTAFTCKNVGAAAEEDKLAPQDCTKACPAKTFKVALVMDLTGQAGKGLDPDFHWYQQNDKINGNQGYFSHKPGDDAATDMDSGNAPKLISTPDVANRTRLGTDGVFYPGYAQFCGCYCVDPTKVKIK